LKGADRKSLPSTDELIFLAALFFCGSKACDIESLCYTSLRSSFFIKPGGLGKIALSFVLISIDLRRSSSFLLLGIPKLRFFFTSYLSSAFDYDRFWLSIFPLGGESDTPL